LKEDFFENNEKQFERSEDKNFWEIPFLFISELIAGKILFFFVFRNIVSRSIFRS